MADKVITLMATSYTAALPVGTVGDTRAIGIGITIDMMGTAPQFKIPSSRRPIHERWYHHARSETTLGGL